MPWLGWRVSALDMCRMRNIKLRESFSLHLYPLKMYRIDCQDKMVAIDLVQSSIATPHIV